MHLFLIGYRGSGKTSVGRELAKLLKWDAVDSDDWIEGRASQTIRDIFANFGESRFRDLETMAIAEICTRELPTVVSLGGGAVLREENRQMLRRSGRIVWLEASPDQLAQRISGDINTMDRRPALTKLAGYDEIVAVLSVREPIYRELANRVVATDNRTTLEIATEIADWMALQ